MIQSHSQRLAAGQISWPAGPYPTQTGTHLPGKADTKAPAAGNRLSGTPEAAEFAAIGQPATFPHPLDGQPVKRTFTAQARALLPAAILADPNHAWLRRQEASLPRSVLGVIYHRDVVELVMPQGVTRRPFVGTVELRAPGEVVAVPAPASSADKLAELERVRAWRAANPEKVRAQRQREAQRRRAGRAQLSDAIAASRQAT